MCNVVIPATNVRVVLKHYKHACLRMQRFRCQYLYFVLRVRFMRLLLSGAKALQTCVSADAEIQVSVFVLSYSAFVLLHE